MAPLRWHGIDMPRLDRPVGRHDRVGWPLDAQQLRQLTVNPGERALDVGRGCGVVWRRRSAGGCDLEAAVAAIRGGRGPSAGSPADR
jgi:hypothetical protein